MKNIESSTGFTGDDVLLSRIHTWVWSGYLCPNCTIYLAENFCWNRNEDEKARVPVLVYREFLAKAEEELTWPVETDCDRLDRAFEDLDEQGILCAACVVTEPSNAMAIASDLEKDYEPGEGLGYCLFHEQQMDSILKDSNVDLHYGAYDDTDQTTIAVGQAIKKALEAQGFSVKWDGNPKSLLHVENLQWKRRYSD